MNKLGRGNKKLNLAGKRFGLLLVSDQKERYVAPNGVVFYRWWVTCDCGTRKQVRTVDLTHGQAVSCGCQRLKVLKGKKPSLKLPPGVGARNDLLCSYKAGARVRGLEWGLSCEQFSSLIKLNCHYCGAPPFGVRVRRGDECLYLFTGIDRRDNTIGYTPENVLPCCKICNRAKLNLSYEDFSSYLRRIATFHSN